MSQFSNDKSADFIFPSSHEPDIWPPGITKRELYATVAMHGMLSSADVAQLDSRQQETFGRHMVSMCWRTADMMCKESEKDK